MWKDLTKEQKTALVKGWAINIAIGLAAWKMGPNNLIKAAGAGLIGVNTVGAVLTVSGV